MVSLMSTRPPRSSSTKLLPSHLALPGTRCYSSPGELCICLCWTSCSSSLPISPACEGHSGWQHTYLGYQPLVLVLYRLAESALCPNIQAINEDTKQHWQLYWSPVTSLQLGFVPLVTPPDSGNSASFSSASLFIYLICIFSAVLMAFCYLHTYAWAGPPLVLFCWSRSLSCAHHPAYFSHQSSLPFPLLTVGHHFHPSLFLL